MTRKLKPVRNGHDHYLSLGEGSRNLTSDREWAGGGKVTTQVAKPPAPPPLSTAGST